ncbi:MAG: helix-turn-helix transcriptional regulator [Gammaproteobacteria bacterium]|jgi:transcriptional regulator with XRE-family HTH domain|nr:helix-turn-helix transcriptional regulator [Gammaproteobacteria bacterium]MBT8006981.1 helix-turn-helix transcriptional regulator [Gammaproteobacteria bacterium]
MSVLEERIRKSRIEHGISSSELARAVGVTSAAVSRWENGLVKNLKMEHLFTIARLLNLNPEWLATGRGRESAQPDNTVGIHEETTPAYLPTLTEDEQLWLNIYRKLSPSCRKNLQNAVSEWTSGKG